MVGSLQCHSAEPDLALRIAFLDLRRAFWSRTRRGWSTEKGLVGRLCIEVPAFHEREHRIEIWRFA